MPRDSSRHLRVRAHRAGLDCHRLPRRTADDRQLSPRVYASCLRGQSERPSEGATEVSKYLQMSINELVDRSGLARETPSVGRSEVISSDPSSGERHRRASVRVRALTSALDGRGDTSGALSRVGPGQSPETHLIGSDDPSENESEPAHDRALIIASVQGDANGRTTTRKRQPRGDLRS
jgi:hypothetical protein